MNGRVLEITEVVVVEVEGLLEEEVVVGEEVSFQVLSSFQKNKGAILSVLRSNNPPPLAIIGDTRNSPYPQQNRFDRFEGDNSPGRPSIPFGEVVQREIVKLADSEVSPCLFWVWWVYSERDADRVLV